MTEVQRTYSFNPNFEAKHMHPSCNHCSCVIHKDHCCNYIHCICCHCTCHNEQYSGNLFFLSNQPNTLTYTLDSSNSRTNFTSMQGVNDSNHKTIPISDLDNQSIQSKHKSPPYSYFNKLSIDNLQQFKGLNKESSNVKSKRTSNSFDASLKDNNKENNTIRTKRYKKELISASKGNAKVFKRDFTDLDRISNSSRTKNKIDQEVKDESEGFNEGLQLHYDYNKPYLDLTTVNRELNNEYYFREPIDFCNSQLKNIIPIKNNFNIIQSNIPRVDKTIQNTAEERGYQLNSNKIYKLNDHCLNNEDFEQKKQFNENQIANPQYNTHLNHNLTINNIDKERKTENNRTTFNDENNQQLEFENKQFTQRQQQNEDLMQQVIDEEVKGKTYHERKKSQQDIGEKSNLYDQDSDENYHNKGERKTNNHKPKKVIQKYSPQTDKELIKQNSAKQQDKISSQHVNNYDNDLIDNGTGSQKSLNQIKNAYELESSHPQNIESFVIRNHSHNRSQKDSFNNEDNDGIKNELNNDKREITLNPKDPNFQYTKIKSENRHDNPQPYEEISNEKEYQHYNEEPHNEFDEEITTKKPQLKPKTKLNPRQNENNEYIDNNKNVIQKHIPNSEQFTIDKNKNELKDNNKKIEDKRDSSSKEKRSSMNENSKKITEKLLNLKTILDVKADEDDNVSKDKNYLSRSFIEPTKKSSNIEKRIKSWLNNFLPKEGNKCDLDSKDIHLKAQTLINNIRRSSQSSKNESNQLLENDIKKSVNNNNKTPILNSNKNLWIEKNKIQIGKTLLQKQKGKGKPTTKEGEIDLFYNKCNSYLSKNSMTGNDLLSKIPYHYSKHLYSSKQIKPNPRYDKLSTDRIHKMNLDSFFLNLNLKVQSQRTIKQNTIMPPNPFDTVIEAREFFFFED